MKKVLFVFTVILLLGAFSLSAMMVGSYLLEGKEQEERYDDLSDLVNNAQTTTAAESAESTTETIEIAVETEATMLAGYDQLYEMNNEVVGWIQLPNTKLDYPVMQSPSDPNFYLYKDFDRNQSARGSIYAWSEADVFEPSDNITMFGHNMADGSMFAALNNYVYEETWKNNSLIFFDTLTEYHTYKIFAVFKTSANLGEGFRYHQFVDAQNEFEFDEFVRTCKELSFYDTGITPVYGDKLICLSTCEYTLDNGRLVVAAVRIT